MFSKLRLRLNAKADSLRKRNILPFEFDRALLKKGVFYTLFAFAFLPLIALLGFSVLLSSKLESIDQEITKAEKKMKVIAKRKVEKERYLKQFDSSDNEFIQKILEPYSLLNEEKQFLSKIQNSVHAEGYQPIEKRLEFIKGDENKILFRKINETQSKGYKEIKWGLEHPIECDTKDIKFLLSMIEGVKIEHYLPTTLRPQLWITELKIQKNQREGGVNSYLLEVEVLERKNHEEN